MPLIHLKRACSNGWEKAGTEEYGSHLFYGKNLEKKKLRNQKKYSKVWNWFGDWKKAKNGTSDSTKFRSLLRENRKQSLENSGFRKKSRLFQLVTLPRSLLETHQKAKCRMYCDLTYSKAYTSELRRNRMVIVMLNSLDQENICGGEDGSGGGGDGGLKELNPSQERRRCNRVRFMKQVFLILIFTGLLYSFPSYFWFLVLVWVFHF